MRWWSLDKTNQVIKWAMTQKILNKSPTKSGTVDTFPMEMNPSQTQVGLGEGGCLIGNSQDDRPAFCI